MKFIATFFIFALCLVVSSVYANPKVSGYVPKTFGPPDDQFPMATAVTTDPFGNVWISNFGSAVQPPNIMEIQVNNPNEPRRFQGADYGLNPFRMISDQKGNIWVLNYSNDTQRATVTKLSVENNYVPTVYPLGDHGFPIGITSDPSGNIWIAWNSSVVTELSHDYPESPIVYSGEKYKFYDPSGIVSDGLGNIWIINSTSDHVGNLIIKLPVGNYDQPIVYTGPQYSFVDGWAVACDPQNNIWIVGKHSVTELPFNSPYSPITYGGDLFKDAYLYDIASDNDGNIWITNDAEANMSVIEISAVSHSLSVYRPPFYMFAYPQKIASDKFGNIWVTNPPESPEMVGNVVALLKF